MLSTEGYIRVKTVNPNKAPLINKIGVWMFALGAVMTIGSMDMYIPDTLTFSQWTRVAFCILAIVLTFPIHEALHGIGFKKWSGTVKFGAGFSKWMLLYFYATAPGKVFTRPQMVAIILLPQVLTVVCLVAFVCLHVSLGWLAYLLLLIAACNLGGGALDFWTLSRISKEPRGCLFEDSKTGMEVWQKEPASIQDG